MTQRTQRINYISIFNSQCSMFNVQLLFFKLRFSRIFLYTFSKVFKFRISIT
jgi:hypothetical protein